MVSNRCVVMKNLVNGSLRPSLRVPLNVDDARLNVASHNFRVLGPIKLGVEQRQVNSPHRLGSMSQLLAWQRGANGVLQLLLAPLQLLALLRRVSSWNV